MVLLAVFFDLLSVIPFVGTFTNILAIFVLGIAGSLTGVSMWKGWRWVLTLFTGAAEFFPIIGSFPLWTGRVLIAKYFHKREQEKQGGGS